MRLFVSLLRIEIACREIAKARIQLERMPEAARRFARLRASGQQVKGDAAEGLTIVQELSLVSGSHRWASGRPSSETSPFRLRAIEPPILNRTVDAAPAI